jgi:S1-C subfamily serine protease
MEQTYYTPAPPRRVGVSTWLAVLQSVVLIIVVYVLVQRYPGAPNPPPPAVTPSGNLADDEKSTIQLFRQSSQSAVFITTSALLENQFTLEVLENPKGSGSGFVWDSAGHIVTNYHVVEQGTRWKVTLSDQSTWDAEVIGIAPDRDLAVLKIDAETSRLHPLRIGASANLEVGQKVFAIGNPFGLDQTLTTGIISGLGRQIRARTGRSIEGVIQTDAPINPGNSGGPLLSSAGELIGVNTAIYSPSGASAGIGFAIPVDTVKRAVPQLIEHGKVIRPSLGVSLTPDTLTQRLGIEGVIVYNVTEGGPAEQAGIVPTRFAQGYLRLGDVIAAIDGKPVTNSDSFYGILESYNIGDTVKVKLIRSVKTRRETAVEVEVRLVEE